MLPLLLFALFVLSVAIFLLPSLAQAPSMPSGKAPVEVLIEGFRSPTGVTVGPDGTLFFTDEKEGTLFQQDPDGNLVLLEDDLKKPRGLTRAEDGTLFFVAERLQGDRGDSHERGLLLNRSPDGTLSIVASGFKKPQQLAIAEDGSLLLSTWGGRREPHSEDNGEKEEDGEDQDAEEDKAEEDVEKSEWHVGLPGTIFRVGPDGTIFEAHPGFLFPSGLTPTQDSTLAVAARAFKQRDDPLLIGSLFRLSSNGEVTVLLQERFLRPKGIVQDALGQFYVAVRRGLWGHLFGRRHHRNRLRGGLILKVAPDGTFTTFAQGFRRPWGLALDADGNLYVSDPKAGRIVRFIAPPPPTLADHAATTSEQTITIEGTSEPEAQITAKGGKEDASTLADAEGNFELDVLLTSDQLNELKVSATAAGGEGLAGSPATATVVQDSTPPVVAFLRPSPDSQLAGITTVEITAEDTGSGIATVEFLVDGATQGTRSEPPFTFLLDPAAFAPGRHTLTASAADQAGNVATAEIQVDFGLLPPTLSQFEPTSGKVGSPVTLTGTNFDLSPSGNTVTFNGVPAQVLGASSTQLITEVPAGATTGSIAVRTAGGTATSTGHFIVLPSPDFTLNVAPAAAQVVEGSRVSFAISATAEDGFEGLVSLAVGSLPAGLSASFSPAQIGPGGIATLTVSATGGGSSGAFTVTGTSIIEGAAVGRQQTVNVSVLGSGITALTGRVLDTDRNPVEKVTLTLGTQSTQTDAGGNFLLQNVPAGADQFLFIDGSTAIPDRKFPTFPALVTIQAGQVNVLPFTPFLHPQKTTGFVDISNSSVERVVTDPDIPGFEMRFPAGVTVTGWDNQPNTKISVRTVPLDRIPLPHPDPPIAARSVYFLFFDKVGGGTPSQPVPVTAANDLDLQAGEKAQLWYYDEGPTPDSATQRWRMAGTGTVSADGNTISTDPGVGLPRFCCGAFCWVNATTRDDRAESLTPQGVRGNDPVDLATGLFILEKTDMVLPGRLPIALTRTYRTNDTSPGPFGIGTSAFFSEILRAPTAESLVYVQPGNTRIPFARQPDGSFLNETIPSFQGTKILANADGTRTLRFRDGSTRLFEPAVQGLFQLKAIEDRNGNSITILRDSLGRPVTLVEPGGRQLELSFAGSFLQIATVRDPLGREVRYSYDTNNRLETVTDPAGGVTSYTYDAQNRLLTITDPRGITFLRNEYGTSGRVLKQTQADGGEWRFAYKLSGAQVTGPGCPGPTCADTESVDTTQQGFTFRGGFVLATTVTDPRGNSTTHRFNNFGYVIEQIDALGQPTKFERAFGTNLVSSTSDPLGRVTSFTYDTQGNVTIITDPAGNVRSLEYEPTFNKLTKITDPLGNVTQFAYDANGNLISITDPLGNVTRIAYNTSGQPISTTDPLGNVTTFTYDTVGNLTEIADPLGNTTTRTYDLVSRLIAQTDPRGKTTGFSYDNLSRITENVDALGGVTAFNYDGNGNLLSVTDARGSVTTHTYDSMDRLETRTDPLNRSESFIYDPNGNLTQFTDRKGQGSTFTYDPLNRRTRSDFSDGAVTEFTFDAASRLIQASDSQTGTIVEQYDVLNRVIRETTPQGTISYAYDALGRRTTMTVDGQSPVTYTYDAASRLRTIAQSSLLSPVTIDYDALGRRTILTLPNGVSTQYQYDIASRLTALIYRNVTGFLGDLTYQYDQAGNRIAVGGSFAETLLPAPVASSTYDAANQQLTFGDKTMTFDANGNLETITDPTGTTTFTWDAQNRLTALSGPATTASFQYDATARRTQKVIDTATNTYQYDGADIVREFRDGTDVAYLRTLSVDEPLSTTTGGTTLNFLADALGSSVALLDDAGTIATSYSYSPFGQTTLGGLASTNSFQFTGRENDGTGLYYYRQRYYHPGIARFISGDPLNLATVQIARQQGRLHDVVEAVSRLRLLLQNPKLLHEFSYVLNSPLNARDPFGTLPDVSVAFARALQGLDSVISILIPQGEFALIGGAVVGTAGAAIAFPAGPLASAGALILGGFIGSKIGGLFDPPCAGQLNCGEVDPAEQRLRIQREVELREFEAKLDEVLELLEKADRVTRAMVQILKMR